MKFAGFILLVLFGNSLLAGAAQLTEAEVKLSSGHPRTSYREVPNITAMAEALRRELSLRSTYSFSRGWWV